MALYTFCIIIIVIIIIIRVGKTFG